MKVSINWLKKLVNLNTSIEKLIKLLPLKTIGLKEVTNDFIELDMKGYNRADLLSIRGVAYEVAAITDSQISFEETTPDKYLWTPKSFPDTKAKVENEKLCPLYCLAKVEKLKVEQSNETWVQKLSDCGMRVINNIADVTNLVMLEYGQPLHAFDADKVQGTVNVRLAKDGEKIKTLDGKIRELNRENLLITDDSGPIGIAGVMGGKDSEVSENTTAILLEAAIFGPVSLRGTATNLKLQSEASKRFYHGLTKKRLFQALDKALRMYQDLGGEVTGLIIIGDTQDQVTKVPLTLKKTSDLIGIEITKSQLEKYLTKLNFELKEVENHKDSWVVTPPYYRLDISIEEDLIEEVARMYGYEKIPPKSLSGEFSEKIDKSLFDLIYNLKRTLVDLGLTEIQTYSYYSTKVLNALGLDRETADKKLLKLSNPMSTETEYLRESIWPNLLEVIDKNSRQGYKDITIFEIGKIYYLNEKEEVSEKYALAISVSGSSDNPLAELEKIYQLLNQKLGLKTSEDLEKEKGADLELFHPTRLIQLRTEQGKILGGLAEVHKRVTDKMGIESRVAVLEIGLNKLL